MKVQNVNRWLVVVVAMTLTATVVAGCGDGKAKKRARVNKVGQSKVDRNGKTTTPPTGVQTTPPPADTSAQPGASAEDQALIQKVEEIKNQEQQLVGGQSIEKNALDDGSFELSAVNTIVRYADPRSTDKLEVFESLRADKTAQGYVLTSGGAPIIAGLMAKNSDRERQIEIPLTFTVKKANGFFHAERDAFSNALLTTVVSNKGEARTSLAAASGALKASVQALLATNGSRAQTGEIFYSGKADDGADLELHVYKVSDSEIRLRVTVHEAKVEDAKPESYQFIRSIILTYAKKAETAATQQSDLAGETTEPELTQSN